MNIGRLAAIMVASVMILGGCGKSEPPPAPKQAASPYPSAG